MSAPAYRGRLRRPGEPDARRRLLEATVSLAARDGLRSITVRQLCEAADLGTRSFYRYFGDVRSAFLAASLGLHADLRQTVDAAYRAHPEPVTRALACIDALVAFVREDVVRAEVLFVEGPAGGADVDMLRAETVEWAVGLVMGMPGQWIPAKARSAVQSPGDTTHRLLAEMAVGGVHAMVWRQLVRGDLEPLVAATPYLVETVLRPHEWTQRRV